MGALVDAASARAVSARSCAEIPVDVPAGCVCDLSCDAERGELGGRTVLVVDRDGVCGPVAILVLRDHHRDGERLETIAGQGDADVPTAWTSRVGWNSGRLGEGKTKTSWRERMKLKIKSGECGVGGGRGVRCGPCVFDHPRHLLSRASRCWDDEVSLVLAGLVVHHDDKVPARHG